MRTLAALFALGAMSVLWAQDDKKKQEPTTVVVEGQQPLTVEDEKKAAERLDRIPGGVDLIPGEDVRRTRAADMKDVLQGSPGVYISPRHGQEYRLSIRGSGLQRNFHLQGIMLLEDGIPLNLADGFGDFNTVDPRSMEYIEVYRGANAFRWGASTLGGAINFVSRTGRTAPAFDARFEVGSWKHLNIQTAMGHVAEPYDVYVSAGHYSEDGFRPHSEFDTQRLSTNVGRRLSEEWETRVYLDLVRTISALPGTLTKSQVHRDRRAASAQAETQGWHRDMDNAHLANKTTWKSGDHQVDLGAYWMYTDMFHPLIWFPALNLGIIDQATDDYGFFTRYTNEGKIGGTRNILTGGVWSSWNRMDDRRYQNPNGNPGAPKTADGITKSVNLMAYVQDQFWIAEPLSIVAGFQGIYTSREFRDQFLTDIDGDQSFRERYRSPNPMGGFRYELTPTTQIYGNVSRSFEAPQFIELLNVRFDPGGNGSLFFNDLKPQRATSAELGTRGKEGILSWDVAYYYAWIHREIITTQPFPGANFVSNANRTAHQGLELGAEVSLIEGLAAAKEEKKAADRLYLRETYNWNHFKFRNDPAFRNNHLPGVPEHMIMTELGYSHPCGAFFAVTMEWIPFKYPVDYANTFFADAYATYGIKAGYRRDTGMSFFVEVRNLTDQRYISSVNQVANAGGADAANFHPAFARAYYVGAELRW